MRPVMRNCYCSGRLFHMRKLVPALMGLMLLCAFALAACGESSVAASPTDTVAPAAPTATTAPAPTATTGGSASAGTIGMGEFTFSHASTTIKVGQSVTFLDPADSGGVHNIVTGSAGKFTAAAGA